MSEPSIEQFMDADFNIIAPENIGGNPSISVENAVASEPFYFEVDVSVWEQLRQQALCAGGDQEFADRVLGVEVDLYGDYGVRL